MSARITHGLGLVLFLALLALAGCVHDEDWTDRVTLELVEPADHAAFLVLDEVEGHVQQSEREWDDPLLGEVLWRVEHAGTHEIDLLFDTSTERETLLLVAWADLDAALTPDEPDCDEDGTRFILDLEGTTVLRIPSDEHPISWCGAILGP